MNYANGKIYKLVGGGLTYYGSSCGDLRHRLCYHKNAFKEGFPTTSNQLFETGDDVKIYLVEKFPCKNKMELRARERYWIETNDCVNEIIPELENVDIVRLLIGDMSYKDKIRSQLEICNCGDIMSKRHMARHKLTKKHILATTELAAEIKAAEIKAAKAEAAKAKAAKAEAAESK